MAIIYTHSICAGMRTILRYTISHVRASCSDLAGAQPYYANEFNLQANERAI